MNALTGENGEARPWANRANGWQLRTKTIAFGRMPRIMGILNATPDSFSDGGQFFEPAAAIDQGLRLIADGADVVDIGGESTRPYSTPVSEAEELRRVIPVIRALVEQSSIPISIDTSKAAVAREAVAAGAEVINDVTGLSGDPAMLEVAVRSGSGICAMHMRGTPQTMQDDPRYDDVVKEVGDYLTARRDSLLAAGIPAARLCLDPGIGFGKTHAHSLTLLRSCASFHSLGCPLLVGHSRKSFINHVLSDKQANRVWGTVGVTLALARQGVQIIRVHDVRANGDALRLFEAAGGLD